MQKQSEEMLQWQAYLSTFITDVSDDNSDIRDLVVNLNHIHRPKTVEHGVFETTNYHVGGNVHLTYNSLIDELRIDGRKVVPHFFGPQVHRKTIDVNELAAEISSARKAGLQFVSQNIKLALALNQEMIPWSWEKDINILVFAGSEVVQQRDPKLVHLPIMSFERIGWNHTRTTLEQEKGFFERFDGNSLWNAGYLPINRTNGLYRVSGLGPVTLVLE